MVEAAPPKAEYQSSKLKPAASKKLKDKVSGTKIMWFNGPPERRPLSVIFEFDNAEYGHETILKEADNYLRAIDGRVVSLEFVPRSVHMGSVYIENQWILTLNSQNSKYLLVTNGVRIKDEIIPVKSYDEFIFNEYERFIRVEKYKHLIRNHEKAVQQAAKKNGKWETFYKYIY